MGLWISRDTQHRSLTGSSTSQDGGARVEKSEPSNHVVLRAENPGLPSAGTALASLPSLTLASGWVPTHQGPTRWMLSSQQPLWLVLLSWERGKSGLVGGGVSLIQHTQPLPMINSGNCRWARSEVEAGDITKETPLSWRNSGHMLEREHFSN